MTGPPAADGPGRAGNVLRVEDLAVRVGGVFLVAGVSVTIARGERVGLIGESGSGKSVTSLAVMGLLDDALHASGLVEVTGSSGRATSVLQAGERRLASMRGRDVSMVFQEPMTALNPTMRVGDQVAEAMTIHQTVSSGAAAGRAALELLERVGLPGPGAARAYPHQLSGGQRQRVVLAMALANDPAVLICDEPTTAVDVTVQALVLDLIVAGVQERDAGLLFITHDLAVVAGVCERILVMYAGRVVEAGPTLEVFAAPRHRYTEGLIGASDLDHLDTAGRLTTIPGTVPAAGELPGGCVFRNRCRHASAQCETAPAWHGTPEHGFACWHPAERDGAREVTR